MSIKYKPHEECCWASHLHHLGLQSIGGSTTKVCGKCNARPTVTFSATGYHFSVTMYQIISLLVGEKGMHVCEKLAEGRHLHVAVERPGVELTVI